MEKYCSNCGAKLNENADVCVKCGKLVNKRIFSDIPEGNKSRIAAALLAFFLGNFGIHNFYLGYYGKAVVQLVLTLFGWFFFGFVIVRIWTLIESIMIFVGSINEDANGNVLY